AGCDSIIHYTLHVQWNSSNMVDSTICASQLPFVWNGVTFTEAGTQAATLPAADQTDSVVVMTLNLFPQTSGDTTAMACESFVWNGQPFTLSDDYQYNYTDINGCDSVVTLHLTINHSVYDTIEMSVLDSVEWHGEWYYTTGQYNDTLTAATGCDSIVTLDLTVTYRVYHNVTLVSGDATMGSVTPMGVTVVEHDSLFTATATALPGRHFVAWMHGNDTASTEAEYTFAVTEDITLTATFDYDAVTVILGVNDPLMGSVNPEPGTYTLQVGEHVHATATAMEGYHFTGWTILGIDETATSEVVDFVVPAEAAGLTIRVMANFAQNTGIDDVETTDFSVYSTGNKIVVSGAEDKDVYVYDVNGRCLRKQTKAGETVEFTMNASGAYLVKVGNAPAKRVVVVR
ncbi:MAG: T9SS type A sorting domain-containing protein, partial [Bacteroidales bacterium]|nr:T9SS type A sorting domain-containing protein [Bacteroidales bacterium]